MGLALLAIIWLITFFSTYFFVAKTWWPHGASSAAAFIDGQFSLTLVLMGIVFVAAQGALGLFVWQYRERPESKKVEYSHGNTKLEVVWTVLTAVLFVGLNLMGSNVWARERFAPAEAGSVPVEVTGMQFAWYFRYPGPDATFGITRPQLASPAEGNPVGVDPADPHSTDDLVTAELVIPAGREIDLRLQAQDVIHGFSVPELRLKQNAVPGESIHIHFTPTKPGTYAILCTQLCGLGHYRMNANLRVLSPNDFRAWLTAREKPVHP